MFRIERTLETEVFVNERGQVTLRQIDDGKESVIELSAANARRVAAVLVAAADQLEGSVPPPVAEREPNDIDRAVDDIEPLLDFEPSEARTLLHGVLRRHRRALRSELEPLEVQLERVTQGDIRWPEFLPFARSEIARLRALNLAT